MVKTIAQLIKNVAGATANGDTSLQVTDVTNDSRRVTPGSLFVAVKGPISDGHDYIDAAIKTGASAIVCSKNFSWLSTLDSPLFIEVDDPATALGIIASEWYGNPSQHLRLVGVTGTNGKTTVATLLYEMARLTGHKAGLLSTVENRVDDRHFPAHNTTPSPLEINALLAEMVAAGCDFAAMEVSSHGMVQRRTAGLTFAGGIFTNLTRDHLDYHKTVAAYLAAKKSFFDALPAEAFALTNADDPNGMVMVQNTRAAVSTYSLRREATLTAQIVEPRIDGTLLRLDGRTDVEVQFAGRFNAYNLLAVYGASVLLGMTPGQAAVALSSLVPVAGRFETMRSADGVTAVVDYAHTPDALANVLTTIRDVLPAGAAVTTVTGAGGNRDHGKRPLMGAEASRRSERVIVTSDNPRDEDPADIAQDIVNGIAVDCLPQVDVILERAAAIHVAITEARPGDVVLIAGKGHEDYQEFENRRRIHFDDREQAMRALRAREMSN